MSRLVHVLVTIVYKGFKKAWFPLGREFPIKALLNDLNEFKCPHPKRTSISVQALGVVTFFWTCPSNSPLVLTQVKKLQPEGNGDYERLIAKLSIDYITVDIQPADTVKLEEEEPESTLGLLLSRLSSIHDSIASSRPTPSSPPPPHTPTAPLAFRRTAESSPTRIKREPIEPRVPTTQRLTIPDTYPLNPPPFRPTLLPLKRPSTSSSNQHEPNRPSQKRRLNDSSVSYQRAQLETIQADIAELREKEASILQTLSQLDPSSLSSRDLELVQDPAALTKLEQELDSERRLRRQAERTLEDVRRECRHPFVVPQILDAFVIVSELTTTATMMHGDDE